MALISSGNGLNSSQSKRHALVIPLCLQAHVVGIYRLAVELAKRGVTITFVALAPDVSKMKTYDELQGLDFNLVSFDPSLTQPIVKNTEAMRGFIKDTRVNFQHILDELKSKRTAGLPGPTCIIYDRFCHWVKDVAEVLNIPLYTFYSCGAILARVLQEVPRLVSDGTFVIKEDTTLAKFEGTVKVPGLPPLLYSDFSSSTRADPGMGLKIAETMSRAEAVIINTFYYLEYPQIDEIQRQLAQHSTRRTISKLFLVGPISHAVSFKDRSFVSGLDNQGTHSLQWLDSKQPKSVLYICIGSRGHWNSPQVYELAMALEATDQSFLWVIQTGVDFPSWEEALPAGFLERTREKGLILTGWVPQVQILAHSSVGGFLTHGGWNSLIESVSSGVPMIGWPQGAEQHLNLRHYVEVLKVAVHIGRLIPTGALISHEEFEKAVRILMVEEEGKVMRSRVQELTLKAQAAVSEGGPSRRALDELADYMPSDLITRFF